MAAARCRQGEVRPHERVPPEHEHPSGGGGGVIGEEVHEKRRAAPGGTSRMDRGSRSRCGPRAGHRPLIGDQSRDVICWTDQLLPSGSWKNTKDPHGKSWTSPTSRPRPRSSSRAAWTSSTTSWSWAEPGGLSPSPVPRAIEQADPGGVSWTNRRTSV